MARSGPRHRPILRSRQPILQRFRRRSAPESPDPHRPLAPEPQGKRTGCLPTCHHHVTLSISNRPLATCCVCWPLLLGPPSLSPFPVYKRHSSRHLRLQLLLLPLRPAGQCTATQHGDTPHDYSTAACITAVEQQKATQQNILPKATEIVRTGRFHTAILGISEHRAVSPRRSPTEFHTT